MLRKKTNGVANGSRLSSALQDLKDQAVDRRTGVKRPGVTVGGIAAASTLASGMVREAKAQVAGTKVMEVKKSVCTHCSVGCSVMAEIEDGTWVGQEPGWDSPFNLGAHCAKGAAVREHAHGERRLKYPTKMVGGKWTRVSWDEAINEVGDMMLKIREESGHSPLVVVCRHLGIERHGDGGFGCGIEVHLVQDITITFQCARGKLETKVLLPFQYRQPKASFADDFLSRRPETWKWVFAYRTRVCISKVVRETLL